jgi:GntR family transcriptional regulator, rspAB operon transcriptional repressor
MTKTLDAGALTPVVDMPGSLAQRVYISVRDAILSLAFPPGTVLRKGAICQQLGVSRSPVAEALTRLASEGLVDIIPQSATRVSRLSVEEFREAAFMREALEIAAVTKVAAERTDQQMMQLMRNMRMQQLLLEDEDYAGFYKADEEFHALIMEFTGFPGLMAAVATISLKLKRPRILILPEPGRQVQVVAEHKAVVDAIRNQDVEGAQTALRYHLSQLISRFDPLEKQHPEFFHSR